MPTVYTPHVQRRTTSIRRLFSLRLSSGLIHSSPRTSHAHFLAVCSSPICHLLVSPHVICSSLLVGWMKTYLSTLLVS
ncbi:hypothetical protein BV22DRAFT_818280 [Leucogyrophana mollusca]|uniref:Uncharacterized protein n=1 Tax=Leucogyrophana mollusca TaxID=85980 RepID=A0ACB8B3E4_9AGAM|nr:hypothetical protein BV22DRAFT_818280 [Leucogyrophana mollusca]